MKLGEKLRYLREVEGSLRGKGRAMTQQELVRAIKAELKTSMSQSYLSQIESGARPHLTNTTRQLLAKFFKVHPGYLVDDPEGYHAELMSEARVLDDKLDLWLVNGAERFPRDPELKKALLALARHPESRQCLLLMESLIETPGLVDRLVEVLRPAARSDKHFKVRPVEANSQVKDPAGRKKPGAAERRKADELGDVLPDLFWCWLGVDRGFVGRRFPPSSALWAASWGSYRPRPRPRDRQPRRLPGEWLYPHRLSLLVWRGRLSAGALWRLCDAGHSGPGDAQRAGGWDVDLLVPGQGAGAA